MCIKRKNMPFCSAIPILKIDTEGIIMNMHKYLVIRIGSEAFLKYQ